MSCSNTTNCEPNAHWQCVSPATNDSVTNYGARGVTYWGYPTGVYVTLQPSGQPNSSYTFSFTGTVPKCYSMKDNCNVTFNAYALQTCTNAPDISLATTLSSSSGQSSATLHISRIANHNVWQGDDISQAVGYNDTDIMYYTIQNNSNVQVQIDNFRVQRIYSMCNLGLETSSGCGNCSNGSATGSGGNMDSTRVDYACNFEQCGKRGYSYTWSKTYMNQDISAGDCRAWTFSWAGEDSSYNYQKGATCIFNINQLYATTDSTHDDLKLDVYLNGSLIKVYYLSPKNNNNGGIAPTLDLMDYTGIYNDSGSNTLKIVNDSVNDVSIHMTNDGINIYRTYQTGDLISRVQYAYNRVTNTSTNPVTLPQQPAAGNILIAVVGNCSPSGSATSYITQSGVTWTQAYMAASDNGVAEAEIWYGVVGSNASQTLTLYATTSSWYHVCNVCEYHGLASSPLDQKNSNNNHSNTVDSGTTALTSQANELWIGALCGTSGSCGLSQSPTNGFVMLDGNLYSSIEVGFCERFVTSRGYANVSATTCGSPAWAGCIATFKGTN